MNLTTTLYVIMLIVGILLNIFIGKLAVLIFKKDGTLPRTPIRFLGIVLVLNAVGYLFHI
ncbi:MULTISPECIES: hypothetical protein [Clostridium]|uniref:hypothetical protein n=1 Tax=Clostridium TaxID=1485 RepID=UPI000825DA0F|nr:MULTISPECIES: hypothetical protein [Clostridium]PJI09403.1 hypothetical protein CUB90_16610 [Clostridium sp. CT7]